MKYFIKYIIAISIALINIISGIGQEAKNKINLNEQIIGVYQAEDGTKRIINSADGKFFWKNARGMKFKFYAESNEEIYFDYNNDHYLKPDLDETGKMKGLILNTGNDYYYTKLDLPIPDDKKAIKITDEIYDKLIGDYRLKGLLKVDVSRNADTLIIYNKMMGPAKFLPESESRFFKTDEENVTVDFIKDKKGKCIRFDIDFVDEQMSAKKSDDKEKAENKINFPDGTLIANVDHIVFMPEKPIEFFKFLSEELQLPVAWAYEDFGEFSCGGVTAGNINLESYHNPNDSVTTLSKTTGIAFEPAINTDSFVKELTKNGINHFALPEYEEMWTNTVLTDMLPGSQIFSCEYHFPKEALEFQRMGQKEKLEKVDGGPLGIEYVNKITLEVTDLETCKNKWNKLLYPIKANKNNSYVFDNGIEIQLIKSDKYCIQSVRFKVNSIEKAKKYLVSKDILGQSSKKLLATNPDKCFGVLFEFEK